MWCFVNCAISLVVLFPFLIRLRNDMPGIYGPVGRVQLGDSDGLKSFLVHDAQDVVSPLARDL